METMYGSNGTKVKLGEKRDDNLQSNMGMEEDGMTQEAKHVTLLRVIRCEYDEDKRDTTGG